MPYRADTFFVSGRMKVGVPPAQEPDIIKGYIKKRYMLNHIPYWWSSCSNIQRTAYNELSYSFRGFFIVRYQFTDIIRYSTELGMLEINTGGWNTPSTRRHIKDALIRMGYDTVLNAEKSIRGISVQIPQITGDRGVFFRERGVFKKQDTWVFESDLGYKQELGG